MAAGLWWVVRSGAVGPTAAIARNEVLLEGESGRGVASKNGVAHSRNGAARSRNGTARSMSGAVPSRSGAAHWKNGDRRKENRLEAFFPLRGEARRGRQWLQPWCLSRCKRIFDIMGAVGV